MSRRTPEQVNAARTLRDDVLRLIEIEPRSEDQLIRLTGQSKGAVKAALRRLAVANLVFSKDTGYRKERLLWCHWPTMIAALRAKSAECPVRRCGESVRVPGMRVA